MFRDLREEDDRATVLFRRIWVMCAVFSTFDLYTVDCDVLVDVLWFSLVWFS